MTKNNIFNDEKNNYHLKIDKKAFLYPEQYLKLIEIASLRQKYNLTCMINTGARINEIRNLKYGEWDEERYNIILYKTKIRAKLKEKRPSPRPIPVSSQFFKYLKKRIKIYNIYTTGQYRLMLQTLLKNINKTLLEKSKVKNCEDFSSHNIRKTLGTWLLAVGVDGFKVAQHLGHTPEMLRTHYASPDLFNIKDKELIYEILGDLPSRLR